MKKTIGIKKYGVCVFCSVLATLLMMGCGNPEKYLEEAEDYMEDGEYEEAIEQYEQAIKVAPDEKKAYEGIINCYIYLGENDKALEYLDEAEEKLSDKQYERIVEKINSRNIQYLDSIHTAVLTAMLDPEVVNHEDYKEEEERLYSPTNIESVEENNGPIQKEALNVLGLNSGAELAEMFLVPGDNNPEIMFQIISSNKVKVWIEGHDDLVVE